MVIARRLEKTILRAPADGVVSVIFAEVGEAIRAGQPVLAIEESRRRPSSPSCCRSARSRLGRPSERSAITIATRCACACIRKAMRPPSSLA